MLRSVAFRTVKLNHISFLLTLHAYCKTAIQGDSSLQGYDNSTISAMGGLLQNSTRASGAAWPATWEPVFSSRLPDLSTR